VFSLKNPPPKGPSLKNFSCLKNILPEQHKTGNHVYNKRQMKSGMMMTSRFMNHFRNWAHSLRRTLKNKVLVLGFLLIIGLPSAFILTRIPAPQKIRSSQPSPSAHRLQMLAFFENGWGGVYGDSFPTLKEQYQFINLLSPFWYSLDDSGQIRVNRNRAEVCDFATSQGIPILPLVTNWQGRSGGFLIREQARQASLSNLRELAQNFQGLILDIENLPPNYKEPLARYVQELSSLLFKDQKQLLVCVYPQVDFPASRSGIHDYQALSAACDGLILMAYDDHRPGTPAGPVAPISWVEANLKNAIHSVPPEKLWLGIPGYGYRWRRAHARDAGTNPVALPAWKVEQEAREKNIPTQWDFNSQAPFLIYPEGNVTVAWYENRRSMAGKIKLAQKYRLPGVALWRLGYEVKDFWSLWKDHR
jgi:spore germination protein